VLSKNGFSIFIAQLFAVSITVIIALGPLFHPVTVSGNSSTNLKTVVPIERISHESFGLGLECTYEISIQRQLIAISKILCLISTKSGHIRNMRNSSTPI